MTCVKVLILTWETRSDFRNYTKRRSDVGLTSRFSCVTLVRVHLLPSVLRSKKHTPEIAPHDKTTADGHARLSFTQRT